jgi:hypothetical protein
MAGMVGFIGSRLQAAGIFPNMAYTCPASHITQKKPAEASFAMTDT